MARIITITSGKGGVGKTSISVNLALQLSSSGYRVCLFDADLGLANVNILLGLYPEYNLEDVVSNGKSLKDIVIKDYHGIDIIPGSSGVEKIANLEPDQIDELIKSFSELDEYDFIIFDTSSGVTKNVISFCVASSEVILVITTEPTSLTDAYALLKILAMNGFDNSVMVIVNQSRNVKVTKVIYNRFRGTVQKYLPIKILPLGTVAHDPNVTEAVQVQQPFVTLFPDTLASKCVDNISKQLVLRQPEDVPTDSLESFFERFLGAVTGPLKLSGGQVNGRPPKSEPAESGKVEKEADSSVAPGQVRFERISGSEKPEDKTHALLARLEGSISALASELKKVREVISGRGSLQPFGGAGSGEDPREDHVVIPLDFEAFSQQRSKNADS